MGAQARTPRDAGVARARAGRVLLLGLVAFLVLGRAAAAVPTNFELVRDAATLAARDLVEGLAAAESVRSLALRAVEDAEGKRDPESEFLVENTLSRVLAEAGFEVHMRPDSNEAVLEFSVVDLGLAYTRSWRPAWFGSRRIERQARARIFARLVDPHAATILWADQGEAKVLDEISAKTLGVVQEKGAPEYLKAELPSRRWNQLVEPVVVTGIVIGLIVLFFSNQDTAN